MLLFEESRQRIVRAHSHAEAFVAGWRQLLDSKSYRFDAEMTDQGTGVVSAVLLEPGLRSNLALELGEFFYQLRAALDGAVYRAVDLRRGSKPIANVERLYFPIGTAGGFKNPAIHENPFPDALRDWLEEIQPYNTAKTAGKEYKGINATLELLNDCARKDRHRQLHVVAAIPDWTQGSIWIDPPGRITFARMLVANLLEGEHEFLEFGIEDGVPGTNIHVDSKFTIQVSVDEIPGVVDDEIIAVVNGLKGAVSYVINRFEDSFR